MNIEKFVFKSFEIVLFNCQPSSLWSWLMKMLENLIGIYNNNEHYQNPYSIALILYCSIVNQVHFGHD
jgi:hypothetical protein